MAGRTLVWFRRDLRVTDNTALLAAAERAGSDGVVGLFVAAPGMWREHDEAAVKVDFWLRCVRALKGELEGLGMPLLVRRAERTAEIAAVVAKAAADAGADAVYVNREYEVNEGRRDDAVEGALGRAGRRLVRFEDACILAPGTVLTKEERPYTVFSPFKRAWGRRLMEEGGAKPGGRPRRQRAIKVEGEEAPGAVEGFASRVDAGVWPAGEAEAARRLEAFVRGRVARYAEDRNAPAVDGTSALSPYLAAGVLSARTALHAAMEASGGVAVAGREEKGEGTVEAAGALTWISELVWRDFYKHVLAAFPRVGMGRAFQRETERVVWANDAAGLEAWKAGRTGFPIVDAGQRQLLATGWMHNRVRMISAMFLTKDLLVSWQEGERFFMQHLVDGDLAANNGGWQWSASTGTDAAPYFRIFNPFSQSASYDAEGAYIRRWVPELAKAPTAALHDEKRLREWAATGARGYPGPIVRHAEARERVLAAFRAAR